MTAPAHRSNGAIVELLDQALEFIQRYVVLPGANELTALALFVAHSHAIDGAHATPYILIVSPEKRSGKTRVMEVLELLVANPWRLTGASEAAMFRKIAKDRPTLLLDELDAIFGTSTERTEPLRAILNGGNRPGAAVARCVGESKAVEDFPIYCAKVLAGIDNGHRVPDTIRDRAVTIQMQRKTNSEPIERLRYRVAKSEAEPIRDGLAAWADVEVTGFLREAEPEIPDELGDRSAEAWEALFAIADMAGGEWPEQARRAARALSGLEGDEKQTIGCLALGAIKKAFGSDNRIATADLLNAINADDELPFGSWRNSNGLDGRQLARLLKPYGLHPRTIWLDSDHSAKGYRREDFLEAWERWLPPSEASGPSTAANPVGVISQEQAVLTGLTDLTATSAPLGGDSSAPRVATAAEEADAERIKDKFGMKT